MWAHRERLAGRILLPDLADELGLRYHEAYHALRRLGLDADQHPNTREYQLTTEAAAALAREAERIRTLHHRSMKLAAAARQLRVALSTAAAMSRTGQLEVDPETDPSGARFVTRASVRRTWLNRQGSVRRRGVKEPAISVPELARFTGEPVSRILKLVDAGVIQSAQGEPRHNLAVPSVHAWLRDRDELPGAVPPPAPATGPQEYRSPRPPPEGRIGRGSSSRKQSLGERHAAPGGHVASDPAPACHPA